MADDEAVVKYRALAYFTSLTRAVNKAKNDLKSLRDEERKTNQSSVTGSKRVAQGHRDVTNAMKARTRNTRSATTAILAHNKALQEQNKLLRDQVKALNDSANSTKQAATAARQATKDQISLNSAHSSSVSTARQAAAAEGVLASAADEASGSLNRQGGVLNRVRQGLRGASNDVRGLGRQFRDTRGPGEQLLITLRRIGNWRPHLMPPFIALIPIIGGLLALLNPLVAILGAVGAAGFAAGASLLSMGGALTAIIPLVSAATAGIAGLLVALSGIGGAFSAFSAAQRAAGGGGGGRSAADQAWDLMKAQERLKDAQEDAKDAQEDLTEARKRALRTLQDLRKEVERATLNEAEAMADLKLAQEAYNNVMADPGSTAGDKADALARLQRAQADLADTQEQNRRNAEDLAEAEKKGVEGSDEVVTAQRRLRNALRAVRDAKHALDKSMSGGGGGGGAFNQFQQALDKLSPSARAFVLGIIAMQDAWNNLKKDVQEAFFSQFVGDLRLIRRFLPTLNNLLSSAAAAMGRFVHNALVLITSPEWKGDFEIISEQNVRLIDLAGEAILYLATAWKDLIIAAGPFAENLLRSFSRLSKNFRDIVADARATGSLARWLDLVYQRIQQWWRIVKNVAQTLWNYGAAAADFGKWITDGLESMTDNWLKASEEARKEDSPFKKWLEDIKPLLGQVRGILGDFFRWLSETAMDEGTIDEAISILKTMREELGPALSDLFDILTKSGIGTDFVDAIASIVESLDTLMRNGGAEGFKIFFDIVTGFFDFLADVSKTPAGSWFVKTFIPALGILAGITFVGQFSGLFALFGWLYRLSRNAKVLKILEGIRGLNVLSKIPILGALLGGGAATGGAAAGAAGGAVAGGAAGGAKGALSLVRGVGGKAGLVGLIITGAFAVMDQVFGGINAISNNWDDFTSGDPKKMREAGYNMSREANKNGAIGGIASSIDDLLGLFGIDTDLKGLWDGLIDGLHDNFLIPANEALLEWLLGVRDTLINFFRDPVGTITGFWDKVITGIGPWLTEQGMNFLNWLTTIPQTLAAVAGTFWNVVLPNILNWLAFQLGALLGWVTSLPGKIAAAAKWLFTKGFPAIGKWISDQWNKLVEWVKGLPDKIRTAASDFFTKGFPKFKKWLDDRAEELRKWAVALPGKVAGWVGNLFSGITASFTAGFQSTSGGKKKGGPLGAIGGIVGKTAHYLAGGGRVRRLGDSRFNMDPRGTDTEPAMLTPGEYVVKKERVDEVGAGAMQAFNDGLIGFAALLSKTKDGKNARAGVGYFNGGGLAPRAFPSAYNSSNAARAAQVAYNTYNEDNSVNFEGGIHLYYPKPETAVESLPRAIRSVVQRGQRRKPNQRLEVKTA